MSFNGADASGPTSINPASNLGGSPSPHGLTMEDIAVIVVTVVVFFAILFTVFYFRQLEARRQRAVELMDLSSAGDVECGDGLDADGATVKQVPPIWKFIGWREPKEGTRRPVEGLPGLGYGERG